MLSPQSIGNKRINRWLAGVIVLFVTVGTAWALAGQTVGSFGGIVTSYEPFCILDTPIKLPITCGISCPICAALYGPGCVAMEQIIFKPMGGSYGKNFLCPIKGFSYKGGKPVPGGFIMGTGAIPALPTQIGTGQ